jgi:hypothetical protein
MAKLTPWLGPHRSDRKRRFTVAVDVAVKILLVVAVRRVERTARKARQAPPMTVDASCACAVDRGHLRDRPAGAWIMVP